MINPPISAQKASGIRTKWALVLCRRASWTATGSMIASAPMFFMNADISATAPPSTAIWREGVLRLPATGRISASTTPERDIPALTTSAEATMMTMSSANPEKAALAGINPITTPATSPASATMS
ncbi:hypothetical protein D3C83_37650 [compost metagenome]